MIAQLFFLAFSISSGVAEYDRMVTAAEVGTEMAITRDPYLYFPNLSKKDEFEARLKVGKLFTTWPYFESSWKHKVVGDGGKSCGYMQVNAIFKPWTRMTCQEMKESPLAGATAGARALEFLIEKCGSLESALGAFASGHCGGSKNIVKHRCTLIGGCKDSKKE